MSFNNPEQEEDFFEDDQVSGGSLLLLSLVSAMVYLVLAFLIFRIFHGTGLGAAFKHGYTIYNQLLIGTAAGGAAAAVIAFIISRPPVSGVLKDFYIVRVVSQMRLTAFDRTQLSIFAGAGEELLFRGAIQPLLGIWLTSVIFVGIHGYFKFKSAGHILFGLVMFGLSVLLGYLFEYIGLVAAMTAHAVYDIIMLQFIRISGNRYH